MKYLQAQFDPTWAERKWTGQEWVFETRAWASLTKRQREKLTVLGWDADGTAWQAARTPLSYSRPWSELSVIEQEAAKFLGYDEAVWESCTGASDSPCLERLQLLQTQQQGWIWEELLAGTQELLASLGWQSRSWFEGEVPPTMEADWTSLTNFQRSQARLLGYSHDTFQHCPDATCQERLRYTQKRWNEIVWAEMRLSEQRAWMQLQHGEALWRQGGFPVPMQKHWSELTPEQQVAAAFLGHSEGTWQGCNRDWKPRTPSTNGTASTVHPHDAVRGQMRIDRPYSEISGNVEGRAVASMPTSFIKVFEEAVARALFCGNPAFSLDPQAFLGDNGEPLCKQAPMLESQKHRIRVLKVLSGSIVVDFFIVANATAAETPSRQLFEALKRQLEAKSSSPICHDKYFGRYAKAATLQEVELTSLEWEQMQAALSFEAQRRKYTEDNQCLLHTSAKDGVTKCRASPAAPLQMSWVWIGLICASMMSSMVYRHDAAHLH